MKIFVKEPKMWGRSTFLAGIVEPVKIDSEGFMEVTDEVGNNMIDNVNFFPEGYDFSEVEDLASVSDSSSKIDLSNFTHNSKVVITNEKADKDMLKKMLDFFSDDQLAEIVTKYDITEPKSKKRQVLVALLLNNLAADQWKELLGAIFSTFETVEPIKE